MSDPYMATITAEKAVKRLGADAVVFSNDQAEMARAFGDAGSALAWADIADAAERLVALSMPSKKHELAAAD